MSKQKNNSSFIKDAFALFFIMLVAAILLGFAHEITKAPIAEQAARVKAEAYQAVYAQAEIVDVEDEDVKAKVENSQSLLEKYSLGKVIINEAGIAKDSSKQAIGYVMTITTPNGYSRNITITMGFTKDRKITKIEFVTINETAGFGLRAKDEPFKSQFNNKDGTKQLTLVESGATDHEMDTLTGATVTAKAILEAVNAGIVFANDLLDSGIGGVLQ